MDNFGQPLSPLASQVQQAQAASAEISRRQSGKSKTKKYLILFIILALLGIGIYLIFKGITQSSETIETSPSATPVGVVRTPSPEPVNTSDEIDRAGIKVEILNGTGISGEAKFLQAKLEALGYKDFKTGNASSSDNTSAIVTFSTKIAETVQKEITDLLEDVYTKVSTKTSSSLNTDIQIVTGLRAGQSPKASASPKASTSSTSSASPTATP